MSHCQNDEMFTKARDLAKAAMNRAQAAADDAASGARDRVATWVYVADGWCHVADLYRDAP